MSTKDLAPLTGSDASVTTEYDVPNTDCDITPTLVENFDVALPDPEPVAVSETTIEKSKEVNPTPECQRIAESASENVRRCVDLVTGSIRGTGSIREDADE